MSVQHYLSEQQDRHHIHAGAWDVYWHTRTVLAETFHVVLSLAHEHASVAHFQHLHVMRCPVAQIKQH